MLLLLGCLALLGLWWLGRASKAAHATKAARAFSALRAPAARRLARRVGGYAVAALAALLLLRGQVWLALLVGAGAVWAIEGRAGLERRGRRLFGRVRKPAPPIRFDLFPDGRVRDGTVGIGPLAGRRLSGLPRGTLVRMLAACRPGAPDTALRLEAYLDGFHAGWRVDAQGDRDAGPGRAPQPGAMSQEQAYEILGLEDGATPEQIRTAHRTLMKRMHPDQGGTVEQAARVNAARDRLTNRHR